jgi:lipoprotein NlpI
MPDRHRAWPADFGAIRPLISLPTRSLILAMLILGFTHRAYANDTVEELLNRARAAFREQEPDRALALVGKAIDAAPDDPRGPTLRGDMQAAMGQHREAVADYDRAIRLAPDQAELFDRRGSEQFKLGHVDESIADFDRFLALRPDQVARHWKRGISYYYAGRFDDGRKQFEGYQTVDNNDVENAVWRYLCMARSAGVEKARAEILPIKRDSRPVMIEVYALYRGEAKPEDVLQAARQGDPPAERLNERLFYAHLYLGLFYEAAGDAQKAAEHIAEAEKHKIPHYMWDVARVHAARTRDGTN